MYYSIFYTQGDKETFYKDSFGKIVIFSNKEVAERICYSLLNVDFVQIWEHNFPTIYSADIYSLNQNESTNSF